MSLSVSLVGKVTVMNDGEDPISDLDLVIYFSQDDLGVVRVHACQCQCKK